MRGRRSPVLASPWTEPPPVKTPPALRTDQRPVINAGELNEFRGNDPRRFPPPWRVEQIPGGLKVCDANGQALAYVNLRKSPADAGTAGVLKQRGAAAAAEE